MNNSIVGKKSFEFAVCIVNVYKELSTAKEYILSRQLLRSGTSIGANVKEALRGQSKRDFLAKMSIALKEVDETEYWILLLIETDYLEKDKGTYLLTRCRELSKILNAIVRTTKAAI